MISIKKYMDAPDGVGPLDTWEVDERPKFALRSWVQAYRAALEAIAQSSLDVCPPLGPELVETLAGIRDGLEPETPIEKVRLTDQEVQEELQAWGRRTARHYQHKAAEVKQMLLAVAHTAESVSERDERCAVQMQAVRAQLERIANLEDITQMKRSIETNALELKHSIERMTAERKLAIDGLQAKVRLFQQKLDEAERVASLDSLTGVRSRMWLERQLQQRIECGDPFSIALLDIDGFKGVNDAHGHIVGDELLRQFASELRSACRSTDPVGRWGGDEFLVVLDGELSKAEAQMDRVREWVCGSYSIPAKKGLLKLQVGASIGLAQFDSSESLTDLLSRADAAMYLQKAAARAIKRIDVCAT